VLSGENCSMKRKLIKLLSFKYRIELALIVLAVFLIVISGSMLMFKPSQQEVVHAENIQPTPLPQPTPIRVKQYVEIAGAVLVPDIYEIAPNTRLKELIDKAGSLTADADRIFFVRNFNQARIVFDQEKYYVPSYYEVANGYYENSLEIYENPASDSTKIEPQSLHLFSINDSSKESLDTLPGVGPATVEKIISNRPYTSIEDLVKNKIVRSDVYEQIKEYIKL
jgi:competence protein ComEA